MPPEGKLDVQPPILPSRNSKTYNRIKLGIGLASPLLSFVFLLVLVLTHASRSLADFSLQCTSHPLVSVALFAIITGGLNAMVTFPLSCVSGFVIEQHYRLSNQSLSAWTVEYLKAALIGFPLLLAGVLFLYGCLTVWKDAWWLPAGVGLTVFSVVLARLAPVLILPLFYSFTPLPEGTLKDRILSLSRAAGLRVAGVFQFNLSKNTKKANAGLTGIGGSRRIILADTLLKEFTDDEIATVFAHELGHFRHHHIAVGMVIGTVSTFVGLYATSLLFSASVVRLGFAGVTDIAALPLLAIWLSVYSIVASPFGNLLSRKHERQADAYAVAAAGNPTAFAGALRKLADMNLADPEPHPVVEFLFHSHPSPGRRIRQVEAMDR